MSTGRFAKIKDFTPESPQQGLKAFGHLRGQELDDLIVRRPLPVKGVLVPDFFRLPAALAAAENHAAGAGFLPAGAQEFPAGIEGVQELNVRRQQPFDFVQRFDIRQIEKTQLAFPSKI